MSMHVGFVNVGSEAKSDSSRPSDTVKVDNAFSGGTWALANEGRARQRAARGRTCHVFMTGNSSEGMGRKRAGRFSE
jgi:hypothetical protein